MASHVHITNSSCEVFLKENLHFSESFTLIELLVVSAVIAILAAILVPVLSAAKKRGGQAACINNGRQLGLGIEIYVEDNRSVFPGIASRYYGFQRSDWIYWRTNVVLYPPFTQSPILTSIPGMQKPSLRCPLDVSDTARLVYAYSDNDGPYFFSYSMTGYGLDANDNNLGMSSVIDDAGVLHPFKEGALRDPVKKIMLAEEPASLNSQDSPAGNSRIINDGRWLPRSFADPNGDTLTIRHDGKADVTFGDGHVEAIIPAFAENTNNTIPGL